MSRYRFRPTRFILASVVLLAMTSLCLWGGWCGAVWAKDKILLQLLDVQFLTWEDNIKTTPVEAVVIRREETVKAPASGQLRLLARHGQRLRAGAPLAEIQGTSSHQVWSPGAGVFCTDLDGLENLLVPDLVDALDMEAVDKVSAPGQVARSEVSSGELIGKLVDNLQPVLVYFQWDDPGAEPAQIWERGSALYFLCEGQQLKGIITEVRSREGGLGLLAEVEQYPECFVYERRQNLEMVTRRVSGWLVPEQALVFKDGQPGLYVVVKNRIQWQPVTARDRLDGKLAVSGENLGQGVRYIQNPRWAKEGAVLNK